MKLVLQLGTVTYTYNEALGKFPGNSYEVMYFNYILQNTKTWQGDSGQRVVNIATEAGYTIIEYVPDVEKEEVDY
jgi:hypothetical protein